jgi:DNA-binding transcriptional MerR regulator
MTPAGSSGGGTTRGAAPTRTWEQRLDDPDEPLFTMAVAADLLGLDNQTVRRLEDAISQTSARPSGNQRRYSRNDIQALASASALADQGYPPASLARIMDLEQRVEALTAERPRR